MHLAGEEEAIEGNIGTTSRNIVKEEGETPLFRLKERKRWRVQRDCVLKTD